MLPPNTSRSKIATDEVATDNSNLNNNQGKLLRMKPNGFELKKLI